MEDVGVILEKAHLTDGLFELRGYDFECYEQGRFYRLISYKKNGKQKAQILLQSGKAEKKLREIIKEQGGNPLIKPEEITIGDKVASIKASQNGRVSWVGTDRIAQIAKLAGAPKTKGAGVLLKKKLGDSVKKNEILLEIFAERNNKLNSALEFAEEIQPIVLSKTIRDQILLDKIPENVSTKKTFMLER